MTDVKPAAAMRITVGKDGPYAVVGAVPLSRAAIGADSAGESVEWRELESLTAPPRYFLCRCGQSENKPFCDGTHAKVGFDGTETASRETYAALAKVFPGPAVTMLDAESLCASARFCDRDGKVWNLVGVAGDGPARDALVRQIGQCPSGRLVARDTATGAAIEPQFPPSIVLVEDPQENASGPIWARGGIEVVGADGVTWEVRNRVSLCRCGRSANKPFCDGTHASIHFDDAPAAEQSLGTS